MSEFSTSFHAFRAELAEVKKWLATIRVGARVVSSSSSWVTFVMFDAADETALIRESRGLLVKWTYSDDFGLNVDCYRDAISLGTIGISWGSSVNGKCVRIALPDGLLASLVDAGALDFRGVSELRRIGDDTILKTTSPNIVRDVVANLIRLPAYQWLSPEYCVEGDIESFRRKFPQAEDVGL